MKIDLYDVLNQFLYRKFPRDIQISSVKSVLIETKDKIRILIHQSEMIRDAKGPLYCSDPRVLHFLSFSVSVGGSLCQHRQRLCSCSGPSQGGRPARYLLLPQIEDPIAAAPVAGAAPWSTRRRLRPGRCRIPRAWASIGWQLASAKTNPLIFFLIRWTGGKMIN